MNPDRNQTVAAAGRYFYKIFLAIRQRQIIKIESLPRQCGFNIRRLQGVLGNGGNIRNLVEQRYMNILQLRRRIFA